MPTTTNKNKQFLYIKVKAGFCNERPASYIKKMWKWTTLLLSSAPFRSLVYVCIYMYIDAISANDQFLRCLPGVISSLLMALISVIVACGAQDSQVTSSSSS